MIHFHAKPQDIFVILSGDQLYRMDFSKMVEEHLERGADVTVAAKPVPTNEASGLGLLRVGDKSKIVDFVEKPTDPDVISRLVPPELEGKEGVGDRCLASMGIYVFNAKAMEEALSGDATDFGKEIIPSLVNEKDIRCHIFDDYWEDIGTVKAFFDANLQLTDEFPLFDFYEGERPIYNRSDVLPSAKLGKCSVTRSTISAGSRIGESALNRCILGQRSIIGRNCNLESVVMMGSDYYEDNENPNLPGLGVGDGTEISNAIIDKNARIGKNVYLSPHGLTEGWADKGENIYVRDNILIVTKNAVVQDGTCLGKR